MRHYKWDSIDDIVSPPPEVRLLSRPTFLIEDFRRFLKAHETSWTRDEQARDPELLVEAAGRICYMSFGEKQHTKSTKLYLDHLIAAGHESVLEHAVWSFLITGVSRAFTHQLVRHRAGFSFSQLSQQYHDESETLFVPPAEIRNVPEAMMLWTETMRQARETYRLLISQLAAQNGKDKKERLRAIRSAARSTLPNCTETKIVATANARALRHFLRVRGSIIGDVEMRQVSASLLHLMHEEAPMLFADFDIAELADGFPLVRLRTVYDK